MLLTNLLPPYREPVFEVLASRLGAFEVWIDSLSEFNRFWAARSLPPYARRVLSVHVRHRVGRPGGREPHSTHVPLGSLVRLLRRRPSTVISSEMGPRSVLAALYTTLFGKRLILWLALTERTELGYGAMRTAVRKSLLRRSAGVLVHSRSGERYVRRIAPGARIARYPQTAAIPQRSAADRPPDRVVDFGPDRPLRLAVVSQLIPRKHVAEAVRYLSTGLPDHIHVDLRVAGSGPEHDVLRGLQQQLPAHVRLDLQGHIDHAGMAAVYRDADALLFPTLHDDWGLVVNEALAYGLPVIGSDAAGAVEELITDGEHGFVFSAGDDAGMLAALLRFYSAPAVVRAQMSRSALRTAEDLTGARLAEALLSLIQARSRPRR